MRLRRWSAAWYFAILYLACRIFLSRTSHFFISHVAFFISHVAFFISHLAFFISHLAFFISHLASLSRISSHFLSRMSHFLSRISHFLSRISHFYVAFSSRNVFLLLLSRISNVPYRLPYVSGKSSLEKIYVVIKGFPYMTCAIFWQE